MSKLDQPSMEQLPDETNSDQPLKQIVDVPQPPANLPVLESQINSDPESDESNKNKKATKTRRSDAAAQKADYAQIKRTKEANDKAAESGPSFDELKNRQAAAQKESAWKKISELSETGKAGGVPLSRDQVALLLKKAGLETKEITKFKNSSGSSDAIKAQLSDFVKNKEEYASRQLVKADNPHKDYSQYDDAERTPKQGFSPKALEEREEFVNSMIARPELGLKEGATYEEADEANKAYRAQHSKEAKKTSRPEADEKVADSGMKERRNQPPHSEPEVAPSEDRQKLYLALNAARQAGDLETVNKLLEENKLDGLKDTYKTLVEIQKAGNERLDHSNAVSAAESKRLAKKARIDGIKADKPHIRDAIKWNILNDKKMAIEPIIREEEKRANILKRKEEESNNEAKVSKEIKDMWEMGGPLKSSDNSPAPIKPRSTGQKTAEQIAEETRRAADESPSILDGYIANSKKADKAPESTKVKPESPAPRSPDATPTSPDNNAPHNEGGSFEVARLVAGMNKEELALFTEGFREKLAEKMGMPKDATFRQMMEKRELDQFEFFMNRIDQGTKAPDAQSKSDAPKAEPIKPEAKPGEPKVDKPIEPATTPDNAANKPHAASHPEKAPSPKPEAKPESHSAHHEDHKKTAEPKEKHDSKHEDKPHEDHTHKADSHSAEHAHSNEHSPVSADKKAGKAKGVFKWLKMRLFDDPINDIRNRRNRPSPKSEQAKMEPVGNIIDSFISFDNNAYQLLKPNATSVDLVLISRAYMANGDATNIAKMRKDYKKIELKLIKRGVINADTTPEERLKLLNREVHRRDATIWGKLSNTFRLNRYWPIGKDSRKNQALKLGLSKKATWEEIAEATLQKTLANKKKSPSAPPNAGGQAESKSTGQMPATINNALKNPEATLHAIATSNSIGLPINSGLDPKGEANVVDAHQSLLNQSKPIPDATDELFSKLENQETAEKEAKTKELQSAVEKTLSSGGLTPQDFADLFKDEAKK